MTAHLKKICQITVSSELAGAQRVLLDISRDLSPDEYQRFAICRDEGPLTETLQQAGIEVILVPSLVRQVNPLMDLAALFDIYRICRREHFDFVHTHSSKSGLLGRVAARLAGVPGIVHHVHGFSFHEYSSLPEKIVHSQIEKFASWFCDRVIFVNDEERLMSIAKRWIAPKKCISIYNGTDLDRFDSSNYQDFRRTFREQHQIKPDGIIILMSGRICPQKQSLIVPEIAKALESRFPDSNWIIMIAGSGPQEAELNVKIKEFGQNRRVKHLGWQSEPHKLLAASDIMLLPSLWEGLPLVLIEAQAAGLPIIASQIKGNREVVTEQTGILCEAKDIESYADALAYLCENAEVRKQFGTNARRRAEKEFDRNRTVSSIISMYDEIGS